MWKSLLAVLCWVLVVTGQYYDGDLDHLGERISAQVAAQVRPLEGLGDRISAQVQQSLRPMQVDLNNRLGELDGLGDRISQDVHKGLEPVRAIELNFKMRDGVGGTTIVKHRPSGRQFLIKNYRVSSCSGSINESTGDCSGSLTPFEITESSPRSDWCFHRSYSQINNQVCMSVGGVSVSVYNGRVTCTSSNNSPVLLLSLDDYKTMCAAVSESAEYRYIPNEKDPAHVAIPNENRYVKCENRQKNYCIFNERNGLLDTYGHGIVVHNSVGRLTYFWVLSALSVVFGIRSL